MTGEQPYGRNSSEILRVIWTKKLRDENSQSHYTFLIALHTHITPRTYEIGLFFIVQIARLVFSSFWSEQRAERNKGNSVQRTEFICIWIDRAVSQRGSETWVVLQTGFSGNSFWDSVFSTGDILGSRPWKGKGRKQDWAKGEIQFHVGSLTKAQWIPLGCLGHIRTDIVVPLMAEMAGTGLYIPTSLKCQMRSLGEVRSGKKGLLPEAEAAPEWAYSWRLPADTLPQLASKYFPEGGSGLCIFKSILKRSSRMKGEGQRENQKRSWKWRYKSNLKKDVRKGKSSIYAGIPLT